MEGRFSRPLIGVHLRMDRCSGVVLGDTIGESIWDSSLTYSESSPSASDWKGLSSSVRAVRFLGFRVRRALGNGTVGTERGISLPAEAEASAMVSGL